MALKAFETDPDSSPYIVGSDFSEPFYLLQYHFHWGQNIYQGYKRKIFLDDFILQNYTDAYVSLKVASTI